MTPRMSSARIGLVHLIDNPRRDMTPKVQWRRFKCQQFRREDEAAAGFDHHQDVRKERPFFSFIDRRRHHEDIRFDSFLHRW